MFQTRQTDSSGRLQVAERRSWGGTDRLRLRTKTAAATPTNRRGRSWLTTTRQRHRRRPTDVGHGLADHHKSETDRGRRVLGCRVLGHATAAKAESDVAVAVGRQTRQSQSSWLRPRNEPQVPNPSPALAGPKEQRPARGGGGVSITETVMNDFLNNLKKSYSYRLWTRDGSIIYGMVEQVWTTSNLSKIFEYFLYSWTKY